ncbi:unnamed protein product, partial [Prorocentrum cordatum]
MPLEARARPLPPLSACSAASPRARLAASQAGLRGALAEQAEATRGELRRQASELREALAAGLSEERACREVAVLRLEEKITFMSNFFADIGHRFGGAAPE